MKKIVLTLFATFAIVQFSFAQWTNGSGFVYTNNPVGINMTSTPYAPLEVVGNVIMGGTNISVGSGASFSYLAGSRLMLVGWNRSGGAGETDFVSNPGVGTGGGFSFYNCDNSAALTQLMYIRGDGNIGIGVAPVTGYKLNVNGAIHSKQINVDLNGFSDFVFNSDYKLLTLLELKSYIALNHHLPDIPSAQKIITDGLNLGEMDKLLTQKVEELTLYMIEKDEQLAAEKETVNKQQNQIDLQKQQLAKEQGELSDQQQKIEQLEKQVELLAGKLK